VSLIKCQFTTVFSLITVYCLLITDHCLLITEKSQA